MEAKTLKILSLISDRYDIDYEDLFNLVSLELNFDRILQCENTTEASTCHAFIKSKNGVCRCSRGKSNNDFCKTHYRQYCEDKLPHGYYNPSPKKINEVAQICVNGKKYLYDNVSNKVYNTTNHFIGYLDENSNIKTI